MLPAIQPITAQIYNVILAGIKCIFMKILCNAEEMLMKKTNDIVYIPRPHAPRIVSHSVYGMIMVCGIQSVQITRVAVTFIPTLYSLGNV